MTLEQVFQSTPLREGRQNPLQAALKLVHFNPRPSVRGDLLQKRIIQQRLEDFNPRPSVRGDVRDLRLKYKAEISIHAPP